MRLDEGNPPVDPAPADGSAPTGASAADAPHAGMPLLELLEHVEDAVVALDREKRYTYVNAAAVWLLGRPATDLLGRTIWDAWPELVGSRFAEGLEAALSEGRRTTVEDYYPNLKRWLEVRTFPAPSGVVLFFRDVTARNEAEAELAHTVSLLTATLDATTDAICVVGLDRRVNACNRNFAEMFGVEPDLLRSGDIRAVRASVLPRIVDPEAFERLAEELYADPEAEGSDVVELKDGRILERWSLPQRVDGKVVGRVWSHRDVTARQRLTEQLAGQERYQRALLENAVDIVAVVSPEVQLRYVSPAVERVLGFTAEEVTGESAFQFIHPDDHATVRAAFERLRRGEPGPTRLEVRFRHRSGGWRTLETHRSNLLDDPQVRGIIVNAHDITERKQLESQLRQSQKMDALGRLAGGVAHDFNNLLTVIGGSAEVLAQTLSPADPRMEEAETIRQAVERAAALTSQLLAFSRRQPREPLVVQLNDVVAHSERLLRRLIGEQVQILVDMAPVPTPVLADPGQIEQVLMNLVINARDAMPDGGILAISTRVAAASASDGGVQRRVVLLVADTGHGMDEATQARIFEPFFTTKPSGQGTGLGLATVYGTIRQIGGDIAVASRPGGGTTFELSFPFGGPTGLFDTATETPRRPRVLLVEDDLRVRLFAQRALIEGGFEVLAAGSASDALELVRGREQDLAILVADVVLPGDTGTELAATLARRFPRLPVVFISGYGADDLRRHGLDEGTATVLRKPFSAAALVACVRQQLGQPVAAAD